MPDLSSLDAKGLLARFSDDRVTLLYVNDETLLLIGGDVADGQSNGRVAMLLRRRWWADERDIWRARAARPSFMGVDQDFDVFEGADMRKLLDWLRGEA